MDDVVAHPEVGEPERFGVARGACDRVRRGDASVLRQVTSDAHLRGLTTTFSRRLGRMSDDVLGESSDEFPFIRYMLSAVVYAERDGQILLLKRAGGALSGQWFLPGGAVEPAELPEDGARRELLEESGLEIDGELELVGAYPIWVYGGDCLQLSYRGRVAGGDVVVSDEHE